MKRNPPTLWEFLKPRFIRRLQNYFRKLKLRLYKKRKVNESKTPHLRYYHMRFKINVEDELNPQTSDKTYEMVIPARAVFFAKILLDRSIKEKINIEVVDWDEMDEEQHEHFLQSQIEYHLEKEEKSKLKD